MPLIDITNPAIIKFLVENYEKTARLSLRWNILHKDKIQHAATLNREEKGYRDVDVLMAGMFGGMAAITRDHVSAGYNRRRTPIRDAAIPGISSLRKGHSIPEEKLGDPKEDPRLARPDTDLTPDPIMRPVDPKQKKILYKDKPYFGREVYIKTRNRTKPEDKYYFAETSGWDYGWRLKDSYFGKNAPKCGRVWRLTKDVRSRTGPHPDPDHYRDAEALVAMKCQN